MSVDVVLTWRGDKISQQVRRATARALVKSAEGVRRQAILLIQKGSKTGQIYNRQGRFHQASAPGEAPASDTGNLVRSLRVDSSRSAELFVTVAADARYAFFLEFGTRAMSERPFLRPALAQRRRFIESAVARDVRTLVR